MNLNNIIYSIGYLIGYDKTNNIQRENQTRCSSHMLITCEIFRFICDSSHESNDMIADNGRSIKVIRLRWIRSYSVEYARLGLTSECWPRHDNWTKLKMKAIEWHCSHFSISLVADVLIKSRENSMLSQCKFHQTNNTPRTTRCQYPIACKLWNRRHSHCLTVISHGWKWSFLVAAILSLFSISFSESLPINTTDLTLFSHVIENIQSIIIIRERRSHSIDNLTL
jgi:hypothetical protein